MIAKKSAEVFFHTFPKSTESTSEGVLSFPLVCDTALPLDSVRVATGGGRDPGVCGLGDREAEAVFASRWSSAFNAIALSIF